ncbi:hypothetical protein EVAR_81672_1 [Eumeta japonica]|uniref:Uncharacterized protein n=1 Tax=Eumeta variegata TaxID=151549 RepID=A0A4C1V3Q2_EUMVA|nr:hypothetical protein EVAR_81672_1 [Eumeta japonica]
MRPSGIKLEVSRNRGGPGQCHRFQRYGHAAANCHEDPKCVKYLILGQGMPAHSRIGREACGKSVAKRPYCFLTCFCALYQSVGEESTTRATQELSRETVRRAFPIPPLVTTTAHHRLETTSKRVTPSVRRLKPKNITLLLFNANGLAKNIPELTKCMSEYGIEIALIQKTFSKPSRPKKSGQETRAISSTPSKRRKLPPDILELIRAKNATLHRASTYPTPAYRSRVRALQSEVRICVQEFRNENWNDLVEEITPSHKAFWKVTKALKTEGFFPIPLFEIPDSSVALDDTEIAKCLAESIESQCSHTSPSHNIAHINHIEEEVQHKASFETKDDLPPVSLSKVQTLIKSLQTKKASGLLPVTEHLHSDMSALTRLDVLPEQEFLTVLPSHPYCTLRAQTTYRDRLLAFISRYSSIIALYYRNGLKIKKLHSSIFRGPSMSWVDGSVPGG